MFNFIENFQLTYYEKLFLPFFKKFDSVLEFSSEDFWMDMKIILLTFRKTNNAKYKESGKNIKYKYTWTSSTKIIGHNNI